METLLRAMGARRKGTTLLRLLGLFGILIIAGANPPLSDAEEVAS